MTSNSRHGLPPRLMAHQPTRFATAQESKPSPSPGIRITGLRRIMLPTQSGELLSSHQCSDARMRRPTRPFTVEIKSSRRSANIRTPAPALVDPPRAEPLPRDLLLGDPWTTVQDRRPAQEAALTE